MIWKLWTWSWDSAFDLDMERVVRWSWAWRGDSALGLDLLGMTRKSWAWRRLPASPIIETECHLLCNPTSVLDKQSDCKYM